MSTGGEQSVARALASLEQALASLQADADCEVFLRRTHRVSVELEHGEVHVRRGLEEGTAVRLRGAGGAIHFGAASGAGLDAASRAHAQARALPGAPPRDGAPSWGDEGDLLDLHGPAELPEVAAMEAWLRAAAGTARASLDASVGVEALGTGGGLRACRVRGVVWARRHQGTAVRSAVARRLGALDPADWEEPSPTADLDRRLIARPAGCVLLEPGAVGSLIPALAAAVPVGAAVGPGWVCEDDPSDPEAPGGGAFDDTGFPAQRLVLADGRSVLASARGPGRRRRLSFRHPPVERAANLRFTVQGTWDGRGLLARAARVHPEGGTWCTVLEAALAVQGRPQRPWRQWVVRATPERWVAACQAAVGPVRRTPEGVTSGRLVFQGLPIGA